MASYTSIKQTCNIPHKRLINLFIFMLFSLQTLCLGSETEYPYLERCFLTFLNRRYRNTIAVPDKSPYQCRVYCVQILPQCSLYIHDMLAEVSCFVLNTSEPLNYSYFQEDINVTTGIYECNSRVNCWTIKGDMTFLDLPLFEDPNGTPETCRNRCIYEYPECDVVTFAIFGASGRECRIKTHAGPLNKFQLVLGITSFVLNRTCYGPVSFRTGSDSMRTGSDSIRAGSDSIRTGSHSIRTGNDSETLPPELYGSPLRNLSSFISKYYLYILGAVGFLLIFASTGCGINACKERSRTPTVASPGEPA